MRIVAIVDASFEEQIQEVAAFFSRSRPEAERDEFIASFQPKSSAASAESTAAAEAKDGSEQPKEDAAQQVPLDERRALIEKLVAEIKDAGEGSDKDVEGAHNLLVSLIVDAFEGEEGKESELLSKIISVLSKTGSAEKNAVKYRVLSNIFNFLPPTSPLRYTTFNALLTFAASNDELELVSPSLLLLPQWLAQWQISEAQKEQCLASVSKVLNENGGDGEDQKKAYGFQLLYLRFLSSQQTSVEKAKEVAEKVIADAIRLPSIFDFEELAQIPAVQALKGSPAGDLLAILTEGSAADLKTWLGNNKSEAQRLNIPEAELDRKARLLDLAGLCAQSVSKEITYEQIAKTVGVSEEDVELWVIDVIRAGLVSGKLSQVNKSFRVYRSTHRTFGKEQWHALEERLVEWQSAISNILGTLSKARPAAAASASATKGAPAPGQNAASNGERISVA
ncbi:hypothetical protein K437DRAFT_260261 [Tilletiaria anomala UBC 951]|uniref:Eukaryotic translation initiation factor 3 subunit M n=1 Tax=Tilletiaria anomala (strain ATCC 24038 / CBS 436.72 / UBC 951) TaxID=1037660 RepID=A0A066VB47_TILAU|nr:uncharacterized protein K437DRAFT_260261 [Tilletiaria anomala UBC 951]KDN35979.1 hypothetical protein K437DRAFT_260261 [Tilletiaria anomala UBC 951]